MGADGFALPVNQWGLECRELSGGSGLCPGAGEAARPSKVWLLLEGVGSATWRCRAWDACLCCSWGCARVLGSGSLSVCPSETSKLKWEPGAGPETITEKGMAGEPTPVKEFAERMSRWRTVGVE